MNVLPFESALNNWKKGKNTDSRSEIVMLHTVYVKEEIIWQMCTVQVRILHASDAIPCMHIYGTNV